MPQLDKVTLFSQVFWLLILYFIFFIIFTNYYLPQFSKLFKVRSFFLKSNILLSKIVENQLAQLINVTNLVLCSLSQFFTKTLSITTQQYHTQWIFLILSFFKKAHSLFLKRYLLAAIKLNLSKKLYFY